MLQLLGRVHVGETQFLPDFRYQLLAYLAYQHDWVRREELAALFWSDAPETARHNLRQLLARLKSFSWCAIEIEKERVRWLVDSDVAEFKQTPVVLNSYQGAFLQGLESDESNIFQTWLLTERELLHSRWRDAVLALVKVSGAKTSESEKALSYLAKLLEQDPLDEEAVQLSLTLFATMQQPTRATAVYKTFAKTLEAELGLTPTSRTEQLFKEVTTKSGAAKNAGLVTKPATPTAQLIGRKAERLAIADALNKQSLLTLTGPGGIGKTRLATQVALDVRERFTDGVYVVSLESLTHPSEVPSRIAETLSLTLLGNIDIVAQIIDYMQGKKILMILDNFEHLLEAKALVTTLLEKCPQLKIIITSREKLNLTQEQCLVIDPLVLPQASNSLETALAAPAAQLFVERAKRVQLEFTVTKQDLPYLITICETLGGIPLALELAAVWVRVMPLSELSRELNKDLTLLESTSSNRSPRHQTLQTVFEQSWNHLTTVEKDALSRLTIFQGGFSREAASQVVRAQAVVLGGLVDKSLLRLSGIQRYDFHPLLHQHMSEKLDSAQRQGLEYHHTVFYQRFLEQQEKLLGQGKQKEVFLALQEEWPNIRLGLEQPTANLAHLLRWVDLMDTFYDVRAAYDEALEFLNKAELSLTETIPEQAVVLARILLEKGYCLFWLNKFSEAKIEVQRGLKLLPKTKREWRVRGLNTLGLIAEYGDVDQAAAKTLYETALMLARKCDYKVYTAHLVGNLGNIDHEQANYARAERYHLESLSLYEQLGFLNGCARERLNLGNTYKAWGQAEKAKTMYQSGLKLAQEIDYKLVLPLFETELEDIQKRGVV